MWDPVFGEVQSPQSKTTESRQSKTFLKSNKGSNFATAALPMLTPGQAKVQLQTNKQFTNKSDPNAFTKPCLFCNKNHSIEVCETFQAKQNKEKLDFLKTKGMCFGCLGRGHMSKNCQKHMSCNVCKKEYPTILHIQSQSSKEPTNSKSVLSLATGSHTGAGNVECVLSIVPVKVKLEKGTRCIKTYAFLDSGSLVTFCTEELARLLHAPGKKKLRSY